MIQFFFIIAIVGVMWIFPQIFVRFALAPGSIKCVYVEPAEKYNPTIFSDKQSEILVCGPEDVADMIGHGVPIPYNKTASSYAVTTSPSGNRIGWTNFAEGSSLAICNNSEDINVINDGKNVTSFDKRKTTVKVLKSSDYYYAIWVLDGYGWCLNAAKGDSDIDNLSNVASDLADTIIWN